MPIAPARVVRATESRTREAKQAGSPSDAAEVVTAVSLLSDSVCNHTLPGAPGPVINGASHTARTHANADGLEAHLPLLSFIGSVGSESP